MHVGYGLLRGLLPDTGSASSTVGLLNTAHGAHDMGHEHADSIDVGNSNWPAATLQLQTFILLFVLFNKLRLCRLPTLSLVGRVQLPCRPVQQTRAAADNSMPLILVFAHNPFMRV
jgi:hypothetical protein